MYRKIVIISCVIIIFSSYFALNKFLPEDTDNHNKDNQNPLARSLPDTLSQNRQGKKPFTPVARKLNNSSQFVTTEQLAREIAHTPEVLDTEEEYEEQMLDDLKQSGISGAEFDDVVSAVLPKTEDIDNEFSSDETKSYSEEEVKADLETALFNAGANSEEIKNSIDAVFPPTSQPDVDADTGLEDLS